MFKFLTLGNYYFGFSWDFDDSELNFWDSKELDFLLFSNLDPISYNTFPFVDSTKIDFLDYFYFVDIRDSDSIDVIDSFPFFSNSFDFLSY